MSARPKLRLVKAEPDAWRQERARWSALVVAACGLFIAAGLLAASLAGL